MLPSTFWRLTPAQRAKAANALQYPELLNPDTASNRLFWLSAWLRDLAEYEAFQAFMYTAHCKDARQRSNRLAMAISGACMALEDNLKTSTKELLKSGGILFAWDGTTALQGGAA